MFGFTGLRNTPAVFSTCYQPSHTLGVFSLNKSSTTTTTTKTRTPFTSCMLFLSTPIHQPSTLNHTSLATCAGQRKPGDVLPFSSREPLTDPGQQEHYQPQQHHCPVNAQTQMTTCQSTGNQGCFHGSRNAAPELCCSYRYLFINDPVHGY